MLHHSVIRRCIYHSESIFKIGSLCNSIVPQIWHLVILPPLFQCNTESTPIQDNDDNVNTLLSLPDYRADPMTLFVWWVLRLSKMLTKMTDTFDIQMNNTFTTKFAHQCKFISALHPIIPINNSMQHYLFSSLELRCWVFFFFGNSHNGCYESQILQELRMLTLMALWAITLNVTFQDLEQVWEYRSAIYHESDNRIVFTISWRYRYQVHMECRQYFFE